MGLLSFLRSKKSRNSSETFSKEHSSVSSVSREDVAVKPDKSRIPGLVKNDLDEHKTRMVGAANIFGRNSSRPRKMYKDKDSSVSPLSGPAHFFLYDPPPIWYEELLAEDEAIDSYLRKSIQRFVYDDVSVIDEKWDEGVFIPGHICDPGYPGRTTPRMIESAFGVSRYSLGGEYHSNSNSDKHPVISPQDVNNRNNENQTHGDHKFPCQPLSFNLYQPDVFPMAYSNDIRHGSSLWDNLPSEGSSECSTEDHVEIHTEQQRSVISDDVDPLRLGSVDGEGKSSPQKLSTGTNETEKQYSKKLHERNTKIPPPPRPSELSYTHSRATRKVHGRKSHMVSSGCETKTNEYVLSSCAGVSGAKLHSTTKIPLNANMKEFDSTHRSPKEEVRRKITYQRILGMYTDNLKTRTRPNRSGNKQEGLTMVDGPISTRSSRTMIDKVSSLSKSSNIDSRSESGKTGASFGQETDHTVIHHIKDHPSSTSVQVGPVDGSGGSDYSNHRIHTNYKDRGSMRSVIQTSDNQCEIPQKSSVVSLEHELRSHGQQNHEQVNEIGVGEARPQWSEDEVWSEAPPYVTSPVVILQDNLNLRLTAPDSNVFPENAVIHPYRTSMSDFPGDVPTNFDGTGIAPVNHIVDDDSYLPHFPSSSTRRATIDDPVSRYLDHTPTEEKSQIDRTRVTAAKTTEGHREENCYISSRDSLTSSIGGVPSQELEMISNSSEDYDLIEPLSLLRLHPIQEEVKNRKIEVELNSYFNRRTSCSHSVSSSGEIAYTTRVTGSIDTTDWAEEDMSGIQNDGKLLHSGYHPYEIYSVCSSGNGNSHQLPGLTLRMPNKESLDSIQNMEAFEEIRITKDDVR